MRAKGLKERSAVGKLRSAVVTVFTLVQYAMNRTEDAEDMFCTVQSHLEC